MRRAAVLVSLAVAAAVSVASPSARGTDAPAYFVMPSQNITCLWSAPFERGSRPLLRCQIRGGLKPRPRKPEGCDTDWGNAYELLSSGPARVPCGGDPIFRGNRPVLQYGTTWRKRGFTCLSLSVGLACTNESGHGFFLSVDLSHPIRPRSR